MKKLKASSSRKQMVCLRALRCCKREAGQVSVRKIDSDISAVSITVSLRLRKILWRTFLHVAQFVVPSEERPRESKVDA